MPYRNPKHNVIRYHFEEEEVTNLICEDYSLSFVVYRDEAYFLATDALTLIKKENNSVSYYFNNSNSYIAVINGKSYRVIKENILIEFLKNNIDFLESETFLRECLVIILAESRHISKLKEIKREIRDSLLADL